MKKMFEAEYGSDLADQVADWIRKETLTLEGGCKIFRPKIVLELFDQLGDEVIH